MASAAVAVLGVAAAVVGVVVVAVVVTIAVVVVAVVVVVFLAFISVGVLGVSLAFVLLIVPAATRVARELGNPVEVEEALIGGVWVQQPVAALGLLVVAAVMAPLALLDPLTGPPILGVGILCVLATDSIRGIRALPFPVLFSPLPCLFTTDGRSGDDSFFCFLCF